MLGCSIYFGNTFKKCCNNYLPLVCTQTCFIDLHEFWGFPRSAGCQHMRSVTFLSTKRSMEISPLPFFEQTQWLLVYESSEEIWCVFLSTKVWGEHFLIDKMCHQPEGVMFFNDAGWVKTNDGTWSCGLLIPIGRVKVLGCFGWINPQLNKTWEGWRLKGWEVQCLFIHLVHQFAGGIHWNFRWFKWCICHVYTLTYDHMYIISIRQKTQYSNLLVLFVRRAPEFAFARLLSCWRVRQSLEWQKLHIQFGVASGDAGHCFLVSSNDFWWIGFFVVILHFLSMLFSVFLPLGCYASPFPPQQLGFWILRVASAWPATNRWSWRTSLRCCYGEKTTISLSPSVCTFWERWSFGLLWRIEKNPTKYLTWSLFGALCWHDFLKKLGNLNVDRPRRARCRLCWMSTRWCTARRDVKISILWPKRELFMSLISGWEKSWEEFFTCQFWTMFSGDNCQWLETQHGGLLLASDIEQPDEKGWYGLHRACTCVF